MKVLMKKRRRFIIVYTVVFFLNIILIPIPVSILLYSLYYHTYRFVPFALYMLLAFVIIDVLWGLVLGHLNYNCKTLAPFFIPIPNQICSDFFRTISLWPSEQSVDENCYVTELSSREHRYCFFIRTSENQAIRLDKLKLTAGENAIKAGAIPKKYYGKRDCYFCFVLVCKRSFDALNEELRTNAANSPTVLTIGFLEEEQQLVIPSYWGGTIAGERNYRKTVSEVLRLFTDTGINTGDVSRRYDTGDVSRRHFS